MGAALVAKVLMSWSDLNDRAFRVLVRMALTALDKPTEDQEEGVYFGGEDLLIKTLRCERGGTAETKRATARRAVRDLVAAGAIRRRRLGGRGKNAEFKLTLDRDRASDAPNLAVATHPRTPQGDTRSHPASAAPKPPQGDTSGHPQGDTGSQAQGDTSGPDRVTPGVTPRNTEEPQEELQEEEGVVVHTDLTVPRAREAVNKPIDQKFGHSPTKPSAQARYAKCPNHLGMRGGTRPDGTPECIVCRRATPTHTPIPQETSA